MISRYAGPAVFLDRDGVLIEDVHLLLRSEQIRILPGVPEALRRLKKAGYRLVVVSNQTVVARGLMTEASVKELHDEVLRCLIDVGAPPLDAFYFCPHHPNATDFAYRTNCHCRKPSPGLLLAASREMTINLDKSFMVGDRITDISAGSRAGCRTILVETGAHLGPVIETLDPVDAKVEPDHRCKDLLQAADWILNRS
jgi:D-glycero-D-manno-heptose 1,7-bisphosphate phosphatase